MLTDYSLLLSIVAIGMVSSLLCSSESRGISILSGPGWWICVGLLTIGPFLDTSSCASMRMLAGLSLSSLVFVYQLTDVVNMTVQLSTVAVLDIFKSVLANSKVVHSWRRALC